MGGRGCMTPEIFDLKPKTLVMASKAPGFVLAEDYCVVKRRYLTKSLLFTGNVKFIVLFKNVGIA